MYGSVTCRRYPPQLFPGSGEMGLQPQMHGRDICGEWIARPVMPDKGTPPIAAPKKKATVKAN